MTGNRWRVRRSTRPDPARRGPWVVERVHWDRWYVVSRYDHHDTAIRVADRLARRHQRRQSDYALAQGR